MPVITHDEKAKAAVIETAFKTVDPFLDQIEGVLKDSFYLVRENLNTFDFWI
jgi:hypothetical protein